VIRNKENEMSIEMYDLYERRDRPGGRRFDRQGWSDYRDIGITFGDVTHELALTIGIEMVDRVVKAWSLDTYRHLKESIEELEKADNLKDFEKEDLKYNKELLHAVAKIVQYLTINDERPEELREGDVFADREEAKYINVPHNVLWSKKS